MNSLLWIRWCIIHACKLTHLLRGEKLNFKRDLHEETSEKKLLVILCEIHDGIKEASYFRNFLQKYELNGQAVLPDLVISHQEPA